MNILKSIAGKIASSRRTLFVLFILAVFAFIIKNLSFLDPDFGWHLKMGEYIKNDGIPMNDPFSYTMSSFPFIDHEWLTNIAMHTFYMLLGDIGLAVLFSLIGLSAIIISLFNPLYRKENKKNYTKYALLFLLAVGTVIPYVGTRPQLISWLYLSILIYILFNQHIWSRLKFILPFFYLLWVNTHGSFGAGLMILFGVLFLRFIRLRRIKWLDANIALMCLGATFLTPYGLGNWREFLQQGSDPSIHWTINEWMPSIFDFNINLIILACLSTFVLWKYRNRFLLEEYGLYVVLLLEAISATRHVPLWTIMAIPIASVGLNFLYDEVEHIPYGIKRLKTVCVVAFWLFLSFVSIAVFIRTKDGMALSEENFYPKNAIAYLKDHLPYENIFSEYVWGGYLDWKLPEKKVFTDGRMATWKWDDNPPDEDGYIFGIYMKLQTDEVSYKDVFEKYNITTVLLPKQEEQPEVASMLPLLQNYLNQITKRKKDFSLLKELEKDGWKKVYEDDVSVIYQKTTI